MTDETPFRIVLLVVSVFQTTVSVHYLVRAKVTTTFLKNRQAASWLTGLIAVSYIAYGVGVLGYLIEPTCMKWSAVDFSPWVRWFGVGPLLLGATLVIWGLHNLGANLTMSPSTKEDHALVTTGAYAWVRHPLYSAVFIESVGVCLLMANWFVSLSAGIFCVMIAYRTRLEEANLIDSFGDEYRQYMQQVGRFFPRSRTAAIQNGRMAWVRSTPLLMLLSFLTYVALGALLFGLAGGVNFPWMWAALGVLASSHLLMLLIVFRRDPDLARERLRPGSGAPRWDRVILTIASVLMFANLGLAPLDVGRLHWSDSVPPALQVPGLIGIAAGMALMTWAMVANTFFSKVVRIQQERGHVVVQSGPYRFVRHPGYVGWILLWCSFHLAIGSWLAVGVSIVVSGAIVVRTAWEDRFLQQNLEGYVDYAERVKWKLIPGIW